MTAAGFLPIGFANSSVGEYAGGIFWVVAISLVASWLVAVIFTPYLGVKLLPGLKRVGHRRDPQPIYEPRMYSAGAASSNGASAGVSPSCSQRLACLCCRLSVRSCGNNSFLCRNGPNCSSNCVCPPAPRSHNADSVKRAEWLLKGDEDISTYTAYVGQGSPRFWLGLNPQLPNESFAEIVIVSKDVEARERIKARIEKAVADGALSEARVRVDRFNFGPHVGFPV